MADVGQFRDALDVGDHGKATGGKDEIKPALVAEQQLRAWLASLCAPNWHEAPQFRGHAETNGPAES
jgi:hypothetical protein